jgi:hypothetical protein
MHATARPPTARPFAYLPAYACTRVNLGGCVFFYVVAGHFRKHLALWAASRVIFESLPQANMHARTASRVSIRAGRGGGGAAHRHPTVPRLLTSRSASSTSSHGIVRPDPPSVVDTRRPLLHGGEGVGFACTRVRVTAQDPARGRGGGGRGHAPAQAGSRDPCADALPPPTCRDFDARPNCAPRAPAAVGISNKRGRLGLPRLFEV